MIKPNFQGFTFVELIIVIAIVGTLLSFVLVSVFRPQQQATLHGALQSILADIRAQQIRTMTADAPDQTTLPSYGVYFTQNQYVIFKGSVYNPSDPGNYVLTLDENLRFENNTFPSNTIIFLPLSGEAQGISSSGASVTLHNMLSNESKTLRMNRYGVIKEIE